MNGHKMRSMTAPTSDVEAVKQWFWAHVDKSDGPDACWLWRESRSPSGYGAYFMPGKKRVLAHRAAAFYSGLIESLKASNGMRGNDLVLHACDNRPCCNPAHLFRGTAKDNMQDMKRKGRCSPPRGEAHGVSKLTDSFVLEIRRRYSDGGVSQRALGKEYGVHQARISEIVNRKAWGHV